MFEKKWNSIAVTASGLSMTRPSSNERFRGPTIRGGSAAPVRGSAGIYRAFNRFVDPISAATYPSFVPRGEAENPELSSDSW